MNPIADLSSPPIRVGLADAAIPFHRESTWSGLVREAEKLGVPLDATALARFTRYRDLLLERSTQFNLTAIRDPADVDRRLFLDALAMLPEIDAFVASRRPATGNAIRLVDVGSGAGLPGLVLKIARPSFDVTLLDATRKKVGFLDEVIAELDLCAARAFHGRAEELGQSVSFRERFDLVTARAVAALPTLLELTVPFLDVHGLAFLPKGLEIANELQAGRRAAAQLGAAIISTEITPTGDSRLVVVEKRTLTPRKFPRRAGVPNQSPLGVKG